MRKREQHRLALVDEAQPQLAVDTITAAEMLGLAPGTLENWRYKDRYDGPPYAKLGGKAVYPIASLEAFLAERVVRGA